MLYAEITIALWLIKYVQYNPKSTVITEKSAKLYQFSLISNCNQTIVTQSCKTLGMIRKYTSIDPGPQDSRAYTTMAGITHVI